MTDVAELTRQGRSFIEDLADVYSETPANRHDIVGKLAGVKAYDQGNYNITKLPTEHPEYGSLISGPNETFYLKLRYPTPASEEQDGGSPTDQIGPGPHHRAEHGGHYMNENFGEARVWLEARARSEEHTDLFAPVVDYDSKRFRWLVMQGTEYIGTMEDRSTPYENDPEELGWKPHDTENGRFEGRKVAYDYGMWRRENDEWMVSEEDVMDRS